MSQDPSFATEFPHTLSSPGGGGFNTNPSLNNNTCSFNNDSSTTTVVDDRSEILTWLSSLEPHLRHSDIRSNRVRNVGDWLLRTEEFRSWKRRDGQGESQKATIFCSGNPGVGKTHIASLVIDTLCDEVREAGEVVAMAYIYLDLVTQKEQSATGVLGALLKQVASGFKEIPQKIVDAFRKHREVIGGRRLQLSEIVKLLGSLSSSRRTFLSLDALDECAAPDRTKILLSLRDIIKMSPTTRVFLTGRPNMGGEVGTHLPGGAALISISPRSDDITRYIHTRLAQDTTQDEMDEKLQVEIVRKISETALGIFLLVSLNLDAILQETAIHRRWERLRTMTDGLDLGDAYDAALERIKAQGGQKSRLGMTALMWICHSERRLGAEELCQALAVEIGSADYTADNAPSIRAVLSCCQGLVVMDKDGPTIRLIHYTLQEYLASHRKPFPSPHSTIAETCLTYLSSKQVTALSDSRSQNTQYTSFLEYSALYWGTHMKKGFSDRGKTIALKLFSYYEHHISVGLLLRHTLGQYSPLLTVGIFKFTGLHYAAMFGLVEVTRALSEMDGVDINGMDDTGATPLTWAARYGHEAVVELLLGWEDIDPGRLDKQGRTPISHAAGGGHEAVVKLLLGREDANPDTPDRRGRTPISQAAGDGHEAVVRLLLEREDVNPHRSDCDSQTPILWAAMNGHEAVVKLLLAREDVNPDVPDYDGQTPISWAAGNGHEAIARLLLGLEDVNPDRPDRRDRTPISWAAENGHEAVVELLLKREDVNADRPDRWDRTPISHAAEGGHEAVVKLLLGREDVSPDRPDCDGQTPILWAARHGHEAVVKLLLGCEDVNPDRPDRWDRTPLSWAVGNRHDAVVKLLLG